MREITRRDKAEEDLIDIWIYSARQWGEQKADDYLDQIEAVLTRLRTSPELGSDCSHVRSDYRKYSINRHRIYYRFSDESIDVVRILHARMDVDGHL